MWSSARDKFQSDPGRWSRLGDGRRSGIAQTDNTVRHMKFGRIRGMVVDEGGRSTGVLLYAKLLEISIINTNLAHGSFYLSIAAMLHC